MKHIIRIALSRIPNLVLFLVPVVAVAAVGAVKLLAMLETARGAA